MRRQFSIFLILFCFIFGARAFAAKRYKTAVFAGGCFWCMEADFEKLQGVRKVISGYTGGRKVRPTYEEVSSQSTGHVEAIRVYYNPKVISYGKLLDFFWRRVDPTDDGGQFVDRGPSYISAIFYNSPKQKMLAKESKAKLDRSGIFNKKIVTKILPLRNFYPAEYKHQDYYKKHPVRYKWYRFKSGRDKFLKNTWGKSRFWRNMFSRSELDMALKKLSR